MTQELLIETARYDCPDGFKMPAFLARPANDKRYPGLVFIMEATGLHPAAKELAKEMASHGYAVLAPELYARGNPVGCFVRLFKELSAGEGRGVDDLIAGRKWLAKQSFVDSDQIAVMGFCMGGGFALILAKTGLFKVAADFYGQIPESLEEACPIFGSFGERDAVVNGKLPHLKRELERHSIPNDVTVYPGVGHGFMHEQDNLFASLFLKYGPGQGGYNREAAEDAKNKLLKFLANHIRA